MNRTIVVGCVLAAILLIAAANRGPAPQSPLVSIMGTDGRILDGRFARVRDRKAWETLWSEHRGGPRVVAGWTDAPEIDFGRCEVVAYFRGRALNTRGERVEAIESIGSTRRIRFDSATYQTMSRAGKEGAESPPQPELVSYGIWIFDRTDQAIVIEEDVQGLLGQPPIWKERHAFPAASLK